MYDKPKYKQTLIDFTLFNDTKFKISFIQLGFYFQLPVYFYIKFQRKRF